MTDWHQKWSYDVEFFVPGKAVQQGSKTMMSKGGKRWMVENANKATKSGDVNRLDKWRAAVGWCARKAMRGEPLLCEPVKLGVTFVMPRPKSHVLKSGALAKGARAFPDVPPDLSKLVRAVEDALTGIVYDDDKRIVTYRNSTGKRYQSERYPRVGAHISVGRMIGVVNLGKARS